MEANASQTQRTAKKVAKLEKELVRRGVVRNGQRYYPDQRLLGTKKPGIEWKEAEAEALGTEQPQGKLGSLQDVYFAVQKGAELGLGKSAVFHLPPGSSSVVYVPKLYGDEAVVEVQPAKYVYVKVSRNGKVFARLSLTVRAAPRVRYVERPDPMELALKYRQIVALADDVPKIAKAVSVTEQIVAAVKDHVFLTKHTVEVGPNKVVEGFFTPDEVIADLWPKAVDGILSTDEEALFKRTLAHEYVERRLMEAGLPYRSPAKGAWKPNSVKGKFTSQPTSDHYGAHDLAPHQDVDKPPFLLWEQIFNLPTDGLTLTNDLSNLDELVEEIVRRVQPLNVGQ